MPTFSASTPSSSARLTSAVKPWSDSLADLLSATLRTTSGSPRRTSTSVTASPMLSRPRNGEQVRLTLGLGDVDEIGFGETQRPRDHRAGHRDVVVVGKLPHQLAGRVGDRR